MDPTEQLIMETLAGNGSVDNAIRKASLLAAVQRQITCQVTRTVLDVRTAVLVETTGQAYVMAGTAWDQHEELFRTNLKERFDQTVTDVIDGRKLNG